MRAERGAARFAGLLFSAVLLTLLGLRSVPLWADAIELPAANSADPITITAQSADRWTQGTYEVWVLHGDCRIQQGADSARSNEAVLWVDQSSPGELGQNKVIAYLEGGATVDRAAHGKPVKLTDETWLGRFFTVGEIQVRVPRLLGAPRAKPEIYQRGLDRRMPQASQAIRRTQYTQLEALPETAGVAAMPPGTRRLRVYPRSSVPFEINWEKDPASGLWVCVINAGVNLLVEGLSEVGTIDVSTDRLVIWSVGPDELNGMKAQGDEVPLEFYMEGNIVFRQGLRTIQAERMYYDVRNHVGMVLEAELLTPAPGYQGLLRLRSRVLQQTGEGRFHAEESFLTSSRFGVPGYRIQLDDLDYEENPRPMFDPISGHVAVDPATHQPIVEQQQLATGRNAFLFLGDVPFFYWPYLATDLKEPSFYIRRARLNNDRVFGTQILTDWDGYQLLGVQNRPAGTDFDISFDYLSDRGFGHGGTYTYSREGFLLWPGRTAGLADFWGIDDHGHDNLGRGQRDLALEKDYRYRLFWNHRQMLPYDWRLSAELGWISDRNFLQQYYEREWNELKDETTGIEIKRGADNITYSLTADTRLNDFFTQTEWYPRLDHFWLGQPLWGDTFTWFEHSSAAYARYRTASEPEDPAQKAVFQLLPWEVATQGERLVTTQEIDWPLQLGTVKAVPYALGQLAHWGEDRFGDDLQRAYWQAGVRASMPIWSVDPRIESALWNVHGLAHKVVFDAEFSAAGANRDVTDLPLYDPLDDDSIENFRRRMAFLTFGAPGVPEYPKPFDPRYYALRTGLAGWVTSPSAEVVDDMMAVRLGARQRWQTKRGMPGQRHVIDWVTLDTNAVFFPDSSRDNFGEALGLVNYDFRWHLGDRLTLVSDGLFDFFSDGQKLVTIGGFLSRPPRGNVYLGLRILEGPIHSRVLNFSYNYWMSPKWVSSFGTSVDLGDDGNIGQRLSITRIGESLLVSAGFNVDASKGNVGAMLSIEPRFLPKNRLGNVGGVRIPVAGSLGLE